MREEYDFSNSIKNPYTQKKKKQISINIETDTIAYFKSFILDSWGHSWGQTLNNYFFSLFKNGEKPNLSKNSAPSLLHPR